MLFIFFQAEDGIRDGHVTGVQTCALPILYQHRYAYEILLVDQPDALFINDVKSIIRQFITEGILYSKAQERLTRVNRDFLISYTSGGYTETILWWIKNNYSMTPEEAAESLFKMALKGTYSS